MPNRSESNTKMIWIHSENITVARETLQFIFDFYSNYWHTIFYQPISAHHAARTKLIMSLYTLNSSWSSFLPGCKDKVTLNNCVCRLLIIMVLEQNLKRSLKCSRSSSERWKPSLGNWTKMTCLLFYPRKGRPRKLSEQTVKCICRKVKHEPWEMLHKLSTTRELQKDLQ